MNNLLQYKNIFLLINNDKLKYPCKSFKKQKTL